MIKWWLCVPSYSLATDQNSAVSVFQTGMWVTKGLHSSPLPPADRKQAALEGANGRKMILDYGCLNQLVNSLARAPL